MNRILITGGTGLLGSNLALQLRTNYEVYILSNKKKYIYQEQKLTL